LESASKLSALVQPFGVGDAIKSWFGLFNLLLDATQIINADYLHASTFSKTTISRELLRHQPQVITSSPSNILSSGTLEVISSPKSATKQERRHAYRRKRSARLNSPPFKCGPSAVEPRSITSLSSFFTDCESASTSSTEGGVTDLFLLHLSILLLLLILIVKKLGL